MIGATINTYAAAFAAKVKGTVETYRDLHIVRYDFGLSPSLAYWVGTQAEPTDTMHFIRSQARESRIRKIMETRDRELRYDRWSSTLSDTTFLRFQTGSPISFSRGPITETVG